jgi:muramidase (phage lysozyme)
MNDPRIVNAMQPLLALIRKTETGRADASAYRIVYGGIPNGMRPADLTAMTVQKVIDWQERIRQRGVKSTAAGAYQIIYNTLRGLVPEGDPRRQQKFDAAMQDQLALELISEARARAYLDGGHTPTFFLHLAKIWASFPVFEPTKRANKRTLQAGESYYAGDGLNKALVAIPTVNACLGQCREVYMRPMPRPAPAPTMNPFAALFAAIAAFFRGTR